MHQNFSQLQFIQVGCGLIGKKRAAALSNIPDAILKYACDVDFTRSSALAQTSTGCVAADLKTALEDKATSVVLISTLNGSLVPIAIQAVQAGKHVLIEKPGALNATELKTLQAEAKKTDVKVRVSYNHRFHPALQKARELFNQGV